MGTIVVRLYSGMLPKIVVFDYFLNSRAYRPIEMVEKYTQSTVQNDQFLVSISTAGIACHSALKLEKSAISKVQKSIICIFKNSKKSIFAPEKSPKIAF